MCWLFLVEYHIKGYSTPGITLKYFYSRLIQNWLQKHTSDNSKHNSYLKIPIFFNLCSGTCLNSRQTTMYIRYKIVNPYIIVNFHWPKTVDNVSLVHLSAACIKMVHVIVTAVLMARSAITFWCEELDPINSIFFWSFKSLSINS